MELSQQGFSYTQIQNKLNCSKGTISYHCGIGQKEKTRAREKDKRNKRIKYVQDYKQKMGCQDCKEDYPYWVLELDHARGDKVANISKMTATSSLKQIIEEIEKCDVVCANCHRVRTWNRIHSSGHSIMDLGELY